jgi:hypothetical protein
MFAQDADEEPDENPDDETRERQLNKIKNEIYKDAKKLQQHICDLEKPIKKIPNYLLVFFSFEVKTISRTHRDNLRISTQAFANLDETMSLIKCLQGRNNLLIRKDIHGTRTLESFLELLLAIAKAIETKRLFFREKLQGLDRTKLKLYTELEQLASEMNQLWEALEDNFQGRMQTRITNLELMGIGLEDGPNEALIT